MVAGLILALGFALAAVGAEIFVRGAAGVAERMRVPPGVIAATIGAFASASPEFSVAIDAAVRGQPGVALGAAAGSNVVNIGVILGLTLLLSGGIIPRDMARRDLLVAASAPIVTLLLALKGTLTRVDGILLLVGFGLWLVANVIEVRRSRAAKPQERKSGARFPVVLFVIGLGLLAGAGELLVGAALDLGRLLRIDAFSISTTLLAVGTAVPELAVALIAAWRGHHDLSLGTLLGSNIINGLAIIGTVLAVHPFEVGNSGLRLALVCGAALVFCSWPSYAGLIPRWRAPVLLGLYLANVLIAIRT